MAYGVSACAQLAMSAKCDTTVYLSIGGLCAQCRRRYNGFRSYANSKLAAILAAKEFQRRFDRCALARDLRRNML